MINSPWTKRGLYKRARVYINVQLLQPAAICNLQLLQQILDDLGQVSSGFTYASQANTCSYTFYIIELGGPR